VQKKIQTGVRVLLGALFVFGGVAFFFSSPPPLTGDMALFFNGLAASKYFFPLLKGTEIVCGLLLLSGWYVPLALVILAPIALNILMVHLFLAPEGLPIALGVNVAVIYLAFFSPSYSAKIKNLFTKK
jgi:uncharacterized membrane protein YphA (DoxX/SURF4 family)